ncbi:MltA domain-containing protein, partial [bacterium]|nr:MltA domain-containing protein [bacterium]
RDRLVEAIDNSLAYYAKPSSQQFFPYLDISHERAVATLQTFKAVLGNATDPADLHRIICERFDVYISVGCDDRGTVLFTGYCTPIYKGSLTPTADFRYPLYKLPADLVKKPDGTPVGRRTPDGRIVPYYTRRDIEVKQLLAGKGLELVWLAAPLEAFIVHVQGSARIELTGGNSISIGYAGKTDRPYTSLGLSLVADKKIHADDLSLQAIIDYFKKYPHELKDYLRKNECYVFFTQSEGGPFGSLNAPVIPPRSIATDKAVFPRGLLAYAVTKVPKMKTRDDITLEPFYGFCLDQDTGGAIRSAGRCDIYMGVGPDALLLAGRTRAEGKLYYLAVKDSSITAPSGPAAPSPE